MTNIWKSVALGATVALLIIGGVFAYTQTSHPAYRVPPPGGQYINEEYGFTFTIPEGYGVQKINNSIVVENAEGNGLQIVITPLGEDIEMLTEARIRKNIPDLVINQPQQVSIAGAGTGLAFKSDNKAFGGASREIWFVEDGNLYQVITYARLGSLLSAIYGTLAFD